MISSNWRDILGVTKHSWQVPEAVVWDNTDTFDRYTILEIHTGDMWAASNNPFSPQGFGQYIGTVDDLTRNDPKLRGISIPDYIAYVDKEGHLGKRVIDLTKLPEPVQQFIKQSIS